MLHAALFVSVYVTRSRVWNLPSLDSRWDAGGRKNSHRDAAEWARPGTGAGNGDWDLGAMVRRFVGTASRLVALSSL